MLNPTRDRPVCFELPGMATAFARTLTTADLERELSDLAKAPA